MSMTKRMWLEFWKEFVYIGFTIIYLIFLNSFNKELLSLFGENEFTKILAYKNYSSIWYFVIAMLLVVIGTAIIVYRMKKMRFLFEEENSFLMIILYFIAIIIVFIAIVQIFIFISNPVLRAILALVMFGVAFSNK